MTAIDNFARFVLYYEAGLAKTDMQQSFDSLFTKARDRGYSCDPDDAGGATMCGVTLATYRQCTDKRDASAADLRTIDAITWLHILRQHYWQRWHADHLPTSLAYLLVDWVWASGVHGIKIPQRILGVAADGIVGNATLEAVRAADATALFDRIHAARIRFVEAIADRRPSQRKFLRGWLRRINAITKEGLVYA